METKEMKIEVPEGFEIDKEKSTFEKIVFKKVERDLPKRWEDLKTIKGYYVHIGSKIYETSGCNILDENKNVFPTREEAEACLALSQLCQLRDRYNNGWKPDWKDGNLDKYLIEVRCGELTKTSSNLYQRLLAFKTGNLRDKFLENFRDLIEKAKPLL